MSQSHIWMDLNSNVSVLSRLVGTKTSGLLPCWKTQLTPAFRYLRSGFSRSEIFVRSSHFKQEWSLKSRRWLDEIRAVRNCAQTRSGASLWLCGTARRPGYACCSRTLMRPARKTTQNDVCLRHWFVFLAGGLGINREQQHARPATCA